jgi:hypothetical protein
LAYEIAWDGKRAIKTFRGHVPGEEFIRSINAFTEAPEFDRCRGLLIDARGVTSHTVGTEEMQYLAVMRIGTQSVNPRVPVAIVLSECSDFLASALRDPDVLESGNVVAMKTFEQAEAWLAQFSHISPSKR